MSMIEEIHTAGRALTYDFRETAYLQDPLQYLFAEWIS